MHLQASMLPNVIEAAFPDARLVPQGRFAALPAVGLGRPVTLVGSGEKVHVRLRSRTISALHAILLNADGHVVIRDLASRTHIYVNHRLTREAVLSAGDAIRIGRIRFVFEPGQVIAHANGVVPHPAKLWHSSGQTTSTDGPIFIIGSRGDTDLVVAADDTEPAHAAILRIGSLRIIRDLGSTGGTKINGHPIAQAVLRSADVIEIAGQEFQFDLPDQTPAESGITAAVLSEEADPVQPTILPEEPFASVANIDDNPISTPIAPNPTTLEDENADSSIMDEQVETDRVVDGDLGWLGSLLSPSPATPGEAGVRADETQADERNATPPNLAHRFDFIASAQDPHPASPGVPGEGEEGQRQVSCTLPPPTPVPVDVPNPAENLVRDTGVPPVPAMSPAIDPPPAHAPVAITDPPRTGAAENIVASIPPNIRKWGPLAVAVAAQEQPELLRRPAGISVASPRPSHRWIWISLAAMILLGLGAAAWFAAR